MIDKTIIELVTGNSALLPIIGIILGIIMLFNGRRDRAKKILASYFFLYSLGAIFAWIYYYFEEGVTELLDPITILYQMLVLPLLVLYSIELFSRNWVTVRRGISIYIPIILFEASYIIIWIIMGSNPLLHDWSDLANNISNPLVWFRFVSIAIALLYSGSLITLIRFKIVEYNNNIERNYSNVDGFEVGWLKWVSYLFLFLVILFILVLLIPNDIILYIYAFFTWVIWIILFVKGIKQTRFEFKPDETSKLSSQDSASYNETQSDDAGKWQELKTKIIELISDEKVYLNADLSLQHLALLVNSNRSYVSRVINEEFGVNFFELVNRKRVDYAIKLLQDEKYSIYSLDFIAQLSGFKCDRTMYRAFLKFEGDSPSKYRLATK